MELEEVDYVQEPTNVDYLLVKTSENWLQLCGGVCLVLRDVKVSDFAIAEARVEGEWGEYELNDVNQRVLVVGSHNLIEAGGVIGVFVEACVED